MRPDSRSRSRRITPTTVAAESPACSPQTGKDKQKNGMPRKEHQAHQISCDPPHACFLLSAYSSPPPFSAVPPTAPLPSYTIKHHPQAPRWRTRGVHARRYCRAALLTTLHVWPLPNLGGRFAPLQYPLARSSSVSAEVQNISVIFIKMRYI